MSEETDVYTLDVSGAVAALQDVRNASQETTAAVNEGNESQTESFFKAEAAIELLKEGWEKLTEFIGESLKTFADAEKSERLLSQVAGENTEAFRRQADAMQQQLGVSHTLVESLDAMALRYGAVPSQVEALTRAVLDYSTATGRDATGAMQQLLNSVEQGTDGLKRMGVQYQSSGEVTKDLAIATQALAEKYGGTAAAAADTYSGSLAKMHLQYEDLQESTGKFLANAAIQTGIMGKLAEAARGLNTALFGDKDQEAKDARAKAISDLNEQKTEALKKQQQATRDIEYFYEHEEENTLTMGVSKIKEAELEYLAFSKQVDDIITKMNAAQADINKAGDGPTGAGDPHATAKAVQAQQTQDAAILAAVKADGAVMEAEKKKQQDALFEMTNYATQQQIDLEKQIDKATESDAAVMAAKLQKQADGADKIEVSMMKQTAAEEKKIKKDLFDFIANSAIDVAKVGLDALKTLETANQAYTSKLNDANVQQRAIAQATSDLQQKYSDQQLKNMSDQQYAAALGAQADKDRAGVAQQLAAGQAAALEQQLASTLANIGEQAAVKALFATAEGIAYAAGFMEGNAALAFASAAEFAAVAAVTGVGAYAISQSRGLTTDESDNLASLTSQNAAALNPATARGGSSSGTTNAAPGTVDNGSGTGNTSINVYGIAGYTQAQQAQALTLLQRQYAKLKTGSG